MIPRLIHQTSRTQSIPRQWRFYQSRVRTLHPAWEYHHWTDTDNLRLVADRIPHLLALYKALPKSIMRADMIRYVYMAVFGGLYLDFDYEFLKPFDLLQERLVVPRENDDAEVPFLGNSVLASEPGHPFWRDVLGELEAGVQAFRRTPPEDEVTKITGPGLVTRVYLRNASRYPELLFARREHFNPGAFNDDTHREALRREGKTYGIHHCDGTWRAKTLPQRLVRKISSLAGRSTRASGI